MPILQAFNVQDRQANLQAHYCNQKRLPNRMPSFFYSPSQPIGSRYHHHRLRLLDHLLTMNSRTL